MRFYIVIPAHNEEAYLAQTLDSLANQSLPPSRIMVVNDSSTDATQSIIEEYSSRYEFISGTVTFSGSAHLPGSKVIRAFYEGRKLLDNDYDVICKFDADLIFPPDYLETIASSFKNDASVGMAGGFCTVLKNETWIREGLTAKDHIRGALKAYRRECFKQIGGLKQSMGWDTVDEMLAKYHGWDIMTIESLNVKHLKPTGANYAKWAGRMQGGAFRGMRYGFLLTLLASAKLAFKKGKLGYFFNCMGGYFSDSSEYLVTPEEGKFIRRLRWKNIRKKLF